MCPFYYTVIFGLIVYYFFKFYKIIQWRGHRAAMTNYYCRYTLRAIASMRLTP